MGAVTYLPLFLLAGVVLVPLGREYTDFRRTWGLTRTASAATTLLVLPALGVGVVVGLALAETFATQWATAIVVTVLVYSAAACAVRSAIEPAHSPQRSG